MDYVLEIEQKAIQTAGRQPPSIVFCVLIFW